MTKGAVEEGMHIVVFQWPKVDGPDSCTSVIVDVQRWIDMEDPFDVHIRILIDTPRLAQETLDLWHLVEPSSIARDHLAVIIASRGNGGEQQHRRRLYPHRAGPLVAPRSLYALQYGTCGLQVVFFSVFLWRHQLGGKKSLCGMRTYRQDSRERHTYYVDHRARPPR